MSSLRARQILELLWTQQVLPTTYGYATEVEAALRGEPYTASLIYGSKTNAEDRFTFICSDRRLKLNYNKHTLARHSLLVKGFIEDFPEATEIELRNHSAQSVLQVFMSILRNSRSTLTPDVLDALRCLTPPTDLYYFLFYLPQTIEPHFVVSLLNGMTEEERLQVMDSNRLMSEYECDYGEVPNGGRGVAIGFAIPAVNDYLGMVDIPEMRNLYPSYCFMLRVGALGDITDLLDEQPPSEKLMAARSFLLNTTFDDNSGVLSLTDTKQEVRDGFVDRILFLMKGMTWTDTVKVMTMLGIRGSVFDNKEERLGPFQLTLEGYKMRYDVWDCVMAHFGTFEDADERAIFDALEPYMKS